MAVRRRMKAKAEEASKLLPPAPAPAAMPLTPRTDEDEDDDEDDKNFFTPTPIPTSEEAFERSTSSCTYARARQPLGNGRNGCGLGRVGV